MDKDSCLLFSVGKAWLSCEISAVLEVVQRPELTRVPLAGPDIAGVANLKGRVIGVFDVSRAIGEKPDSFKNMIVLTASGRSFGLLAGEVSGIFKVPDGAVKKQDGASGVTKGTFEYNGKKYLCLDPEKLLKARQGVL